MVNDYNVFVIPSAARNLHIFCVTNFSSLVKLLLRRTLVRLVL